MFARHKRLAEGDADGHVPGVGVFLWSAKAIKTPQTRLPRSAPTAAGVGNNALLKHGRDKYALSLGGGIGEENSTAQAFPIGPLGSLNRLEEVMGMIGGIPRRRSPSLRGQNLVQGSWPAKLAATAANLPVLKQNPAARSILRWLLAKERRQTKTRGRRNMGFRLPHRFARSLARNGERTSDRLKPAELAALLPRLLAGSEAAGELQPAAV